MSSQDLRTALLWKYGHLRKSGRFPGTHKQLIADLQRRWPRLARELPKSPDRAFSLIDVRVGGPTRFITVAFILHLIHPEQVPIIDQHNFRAVNALIREVRATWQGNKRPSRYTDITFVAAFMATVISMWRQRDPATVPEPRRLDQYLMEYGRGLKARHNKDLQPTAAGAIMRRRG